MERWRGRDLRHERKRRKGVTADRLGRALGIHHTTLRDVELERVGEYTDPAFASRYLEALERLEGETA